MTTHQVLLVGNEGASLCLARRGNVHTVSPLPPPAQAVAALRAAASGRSALVLLDVVEEEYRLETLPPTGRRDRQALLERRLAAAFEVTPWRLALPLKPESEAPAGSRALLCALTAPVRIQPWLAALAAAGISLAGLYSLPVLSAAPLPACGLAKGNAALLFRRPRGGLRLCFFVEGQLQGSRLLVAETMGETEAQAVWLDAINRLRPWLAHAGLLPPEAVLEVGLLTTDESLAALQPRLPVLANTRFHPLDAGMLAGRYGLSPALCAAPEEALWAQLLLRLPPVHQYATRADRAAWRADGWRRLAVGCGSGLCIALGLGAAAATQRGLAAVREADALAASNWTQGTALAARRRALPALLLPSAEGVALASFCESLGQAGPPTSAALIWLEQTLATVPGVTWTRIEWPDPDDPAGLVVQGEVQPFSGDYRMAMTAIEQLVAALRARPELASVRLRQSPLPAPGGPGERLRSDGVEARFTLDLSLQTAPDAPRS